MSRIEKQSKIYESVDDLKRVVQQWKLEGSKVVFTNGCFDLLHRGHIFSLQQAADQGDKLIIGLNSDISVKKLKGDSRPIMSEIDRATILANVIMVDAVVIFNEETPLEVISILIPDVLIKGKDYQTKEIVGSDIVIKNGGEVKTVEMLQGISTSDIVNKIKQSQ